MARYILVAFSDDASAAEFVEAVQRPGGFFFLGKDGHFRTANNEESAHTATVDAVWQYPTKFCECGTYQGKDAKSKKYSWYVHAECGKPRRGTYQHPKDLLHPEIPAKDRTMYLGFRAGRTLPTPPEPHGGTSG